jgi:hypothetical protein
MVQYGCSKRGTEREDTTMYNLTVSTLTKPNAVDIVIINEDTAIDYFNMAVRAVDAYEVAMIDAFTGEVINLWSNGKFTVLDRTVVH